MLGRGGGLVSPGWGDSTLRSPPGAALFIKQEQGAGRQLPPCPASRGHRARWPGGTAALLTGRDNGDAGACRAGRATGRADATLGSAARGCHSTWGRPARPRVPHAGAEPHAEPGGCRNPVQRARFLGDAELQPRLHPSSLQAEQDAAPARSPAACPCHRAPLATANRFSLSLAQFARLLPLPVPPPGRGKAELGL